MASWDDSEESSLDEEVQAILCLMATRLEASKNEVSASELPTSSDFKELEYAFDNLLYDSHTISIKCITLKHQLSKA